MCVPTFRPYCKIYPSNYFNCKLLNCLLVIQLCNFRIGYYCCFLLLKYYRFCMFTNHSTTVDECLKQICTVQTNHFDPTIRAFVFRIKTRFPGKQQCIGHVDKIEQKSTGNRSGTERDTGGNDPDARKRNGRCPRAQTIIKTNRKPIESTLLKIIT